MEYGHFRQFVLTIFIVVGTTLASVRQGDAFCNGVIPDHVGPRSRWQYRFQSVPYRDLTPLSMAKGTKKNKTGGGGLKGFGSMSVVSSSSSSKKVSVELDRSKDAREFYAFMQEGGAGDNLSRCALGKFPLTESGDVTLRGVVALKPCKKGDVIIQIPYELAANLGQEGVDPTIPAVTFLKDYCETLGNDESADATKSSSAAYYRMLPPFEGDDCLGSTDFFSDRALQELQFPHVVDETLKRRELVHARFRLGISTSNDFPKWIDGSDVTKEHLLWAVWLITSRVLTVTGDESQGRSYRLLIPFLDMCNHDRASPHVLTGRAVPGGSLNVVAGAPVKEGDAINICYGGGMAGNDRFVQDYGFLDSGIDCTAYNMVAQQLMGKRRLVEGVGAGQFMSQADIARALDELKRTTIEQDVQLLADETDTQLITACNFRLGVKRALSNYGAS
jgi:hypothetical protein